MIEQTVRSDGHGGTKVMRFSASGAIKQFCRECFGFERGAPKDCTDPLCPLFHFRVSGAHKDALKTTAGKRIKG